MVADDARLAAMLETNRSAFADEAALLRHLRRGRSVSMVLSEYRLPREQILRSSPTRSALRLMFGSLPPAPSGSRITMGGFAH